MSMDRWARVTRGRKLALSGVLALLFGLTAMGDAVTLGAATTTRVSVHTDGTEGDWHSRSASLSANGRLVVFQSAASNLVDGDLAGVSDIFIHDRTTGKTRRLTRGFDGSEANVDSFSPVISANGRYVAFVSHARNLVPDDTNEVEDIFVLDRGTGITTRISLRSNGRQANGRSDSPAISSDGRFVAFRSAASNLVKGDTNGVADVFVHDRGTGRTARVSVRSNGAQANDGSHEPDISADGRFVVFRSNASDLVKGDTNGKEDIFVHDRRTGITTRASLRSSGAQANDDSESPIVSADGRIVVFESEATNLIRGDSNGFVDVFVHDRVTGRTRRISRHSDGTAGNGSSSSARTSADGRFVAFRSNATNLVGNDANGKADVFIHDRATGRTRLVSRAWDGQPSDGHSWTSAIDPYGRFVVFESEATNLVDGDANDVFDIFVRGPLR